MAQKDPQIVVVGGTYIDMAVKCDHIPLPGQSVIGSEMSHSVAGPGPLEAVQVAMCGCQSLLISKVGGDCFAEMVRATLADFKVDASYVFIAEAKNTGTSVTLVNGEGENATCFYSGANMALTAEDIDSAEYAIAEADVCLINGRMPTVAVARAIRQAKVHGTKVIVNPSRPLQIQGERPSDFPDDYFLADVLIANLYEAADITEISDANIRDAKLIGSDLMARGTEAVVITIGKRGCMVIDRNGADHIPAFEVELVDHTGTGDAFAGAFAAFMAVHDDIREAAKFASAAGALACTKFGTLESLPTQAEIIEMLQSEDTM